MKVFHIDRSWDGKPIDERERVVLEVESDRQGLKIAIDAPYHADPAPVVPAGRCDGLWEFEVAELFLVGESGHYVEFEFGPHGHYLALKFSGPRNAIDRCLSVDYRASIERDRWSGTAELSKTLIPAPITRWNAFAIHGPPERRRYLAACPLFGTEPDFHRIDLFPPANID